MLHARFFMSFIACTQVVLAAPVVVVPAQTQESQGIRYSYEVSNLASNSVVSLQIGFDYFRGSPQLTVLPNGWTVESGLPTASFQSPPGWELRLLVTEDDPYVNLEWSSDTSAANDIKAGASKRGFSVVVPVQDDRYLTGSFAAILSNSEVVSAQMGAPRLTLEVVTGGTWIRWSTAYGSDWVVEVSESLDAEGSWLGLEIEPFVSESSYELFVDETGANSLFYRLRQR